MKQAAVERDRRHHEITLIRKNEPERLFPELYNETWSRPIVANQIDSIAREFSEMIAALPQLTCSSGAMKTDADKRRAGIRNKIGGHYWLVSNLKTRMYGLADSYGSYGFGVFIVEPDYAKQTPMLRTMPSVGSYYELDRDGNTVRYAYCTKQTVEKLCDQFPQFATQIKSKLTDFGTVVEASGLEKLETVLYCDGDTWRLFLPARADLVLAQYDNVLPSKRCPVRIVERPSLFPVPEGAYDDVIFVQLAKGRMALLALEAGQKAVGAPIAVPRDVSELAVGPDAVIVSDSPEKIGRVRLDVPNAAFALQQTLDQEVRFGTRYPEGRAGGIQASVITGQGVNALMGSFDTQISVSQTIIGEGLARATEMCFEMDAAVWPQVRKQITGSFAGEPYDFSYTPAQAIGSNFSCQVTYGFAAGMAPNAAAVMLLQLRGDKLIDRATVQRNLPFSIDPEQMQRNVDVEEIADAAKQGLFGMLQSLGPAMAQGIDPTPFLRAAATVVQGRRDGKPLEDVLLAAFDPKNLAPPAPEGQPAQVADQGAPAGPGQGPGAGALPGQDALTGLPNGIVPGQAGQGPGGAPDLQTLVAGLRHGRLQMDASVSRRLPVG